MNWRAFQETAKRLAQGPTEGDWRSAISRAYYAVFHFFNDLCLTEGLDLGQGGQAHTNLYQGLNNCGMASVQKIADRVDELRSARTKADYRLAHATSRAGAGAWVREADAIRADFQSILAASSAKTIVAGAKAHLKAIGRVP